MTTAALSTKRSQIWKEIRTLRAQKKAAKSAEARKKIRDRYRALVQELAATRKGLSSRKAKPAAKKQPKAA